MIYIIDLRIFLFSKIRIWSYTFPSEYCLSCAPRILICYFSFSLSQPPWHPGRRASLLLPSRVGASVPHMASTVKGDLATAQQGGPFRLPTFPSLIHPAHHSDMGEGLRHFITAWQGWKSRLPTLPCWWAWDHSFFLRRLAGVQQLLSKFSVLLGCPFAGPLTQEQDFLGAFCVCTHWHFQAASFLRTNSGYMRKKNPENSLLHHLTGVQTPGQSASSPPFQSLVFASYRLLAVRSRRNRNKCFSIILDTDVLWLILRFSLFITSIEHLDYAMPWCSFPHVFCAWGLLRCLDSGFIVFIKFRKVSAIISSNIYFFVFPSLSSTLGIQLHIY